jgi:hypothetical protein
MKSRKRGDDMTYAELTAASGVRDDEHMIYEMGHISQYSDGSVLNCATMKMYTAQEILDDEEGQAAMWKLNPHKRAIWGDLRRNAKAALKNGSTRNLAPGF